MNDSEKLDLILEKITSMNKEMSDMGTRLRNLELHIENVTDKNIQTIAEGHFDLSRKLDDALRTENEKELFLIRLRMLEDDLRKMKEKIESIA